MKLSTRKQWIIRFTLSLIFGIAVTSVPLALILGGANTSRFDYPQLSTTRKILKIDRALEKHKIRQGHYPEDLQSADLATRDGWRHPMLYSLPVGEPLIESLGRDGKRGGLGRDADSSNRNLNPPEARVSFWQRLFEPLAQGVVIASGICGLIGALLVYGGLRKQNFEPRSWAALALSLALSLALAIFGAAVITAFHVPSGH